MGVGFSEACFFRSLSLMVFTLSGPPPAESLSEAGAAANRGGRPRCCQAADLAGREAATAQAVGLEFQLWALPAFFLPRQTSGGGGDEGVEGGGQRLEDLSTTGSATGGKRLSQPLPGHGAMPRPSITRSGGARKTCVQKSGSGTTCWASL